MVVAYWEDPEDSDNGTNCGFENQEELLEWANATVLHRPSE